MLIKSSISVAIFGLLAQAAYGKAIDKHHPHGDDGFVKTTETGFTLNGNPYFIRGVNYWHGINMGSLDGGNRTRLDLELDQLAAMGVNNVRIVTGTEGPDGEPFRMRPALMDSPGKYNEKIYQGLDYFIDALGKRNMTAVATLGNFWHWSGGFSQYINWITGETPPYPTNNPYTYDEFTNWTRRFYTDPKIAKKADKLFKDNIKKIQNHKNTFNGKAYNEDSTIMAWEIANEPQSAPAHWFDDVAKFIKSNAPKQLVTGGIESKLDEQDFMNAHASKYIDYCTSHLWVENWGIYDPFKEDGLQAALDYAKEYISTRVDWAKKVKKPIVMEEFGMARDAWKQPNSQWAKWDPETSTEHKDKYYDYMLSEIYKQVEAGGPYAGSNFWAYGGVGRPYEDPNQYGMYLLGDPPHEPRGWYSVYDTDTTVSVIKNQYKKLADLEKK
ncbi:uncharacterized protein ATC70_008243 [Mucor velutinosus]|uniref:mannan endo-1,4-beta-mannosidase n=1 Tax=Mucor velutinosus TaxID=708070 RepID=A0AAN7DMZ3_9FUNG|nr:hypothetical protein ATC70_008243 [Mucor velutinosus]